ncbi:MAG TPA: hypothetical protein VJ914_16325 [Pseudonocardiaceae bacterium]|nr:hypothetical protein [Pseudonocardiaceae bacterium]
MATPPGTSLPDRPTVSHPDAMSPEALADARGNQPKRGLIGLAFVVPLTVVLSLAADGPVHSLLVLGPIITFGLPFVSAIAFWWEDWPGSLLRRPWSGLYDTAIVAVGGVLLTMLGQVIVNGPDLIGVFAPGAGHPSTFPNTLPLGGGVFTVILQLTLVWERWPLSKLGRIRSGLAAIALSWLLGLVMWLLAVKAIAIPADHYGAWLTSIGLWQVLGYIALRGWPLSWISRRWLRLLVGNVAVIGLGWLTYLLFVHAIGWSTIVTIAVNGTGIGCFLLIAMLFEAWPAVRLTPRPGPGLTIVLVSGVVLTALLLWLLPLLAGALGLSGLDRWGFTTQVTLNALSTVVILHVAIWDRWPVRGRP